LQGGTFVTNLVVANLLGAEHFGQFGVVVNTAQTLGAVLQLSTGMAATKYISEFRASDPERASRALGLCERISLGAGSIGAVLMALLAGFIAQSLMKTPSLSTSLLYAAPIVLSSILTSFQIGALAGLEGFRHAARTLLALTAIQIASVGLATWGFGLAGAVIALSLNFALRAVTCHVVLRREAARVGLRSARGDAAESRRMFFGFLLPGAMTGLTAMPSMWLVTVTLSKQAGFVDLAYFNASLAIRSILMILPWILSTVGLSLLSNQLGTGQRSQFSKVLWASLGATLTAVVVGQLAVLLFGGRILALYGAQFRAALPVLQVLLISLAAEALALPLYQALASQSRMWSTFVLGLLPRDLLLLVLGLWWIPAHGATGLAWAHSAAFSYTLVILAMLVAQRHASTGNASAASAS